jgi:4-hydroxybenzoate polyprenyltransferase
MTNLIREIIKDAQDIEGDKEQNSKTLPILYGPKVTNRVIIGLTILTVLGLGFLSICFLKETVSLLYCVIALLLPSIFLIIRTLKSEKTQDYRFLSMLVKIIMLLGLLYAPVVQWLTGIS